MRFKKLDLNLLVALDAMLKERSISRAAERLHLTQSAMSNALARLREYFDGELVVQVGRRMALHPMRTTASWSRRRSQRRPGGRSGESMREPCGNELRPVLHSPAQCPQRAPAIDI
jgi:hypothetical protein